MLSPYLWDTIWKQKSPLESNIFLWQCGQKIIPTLSFLKQRGIVSTEVRKWCNEVEEDFDNHFWSCQLLRNAWNILKKWLNIVLTQVYHFDKEQCFKHVIIK